MVEKNWMPANFSSHHHVHPCQVTGHCHSCFLGTPYMQMYIQVHGFFCMTVHFVVVQPVLQVHLITFRMFWEGVTGNMANATKGTNFHMEPTQSKDWRLHVTVGWFTLCDWHCFPPQRLVKRSRLVWSCKTWPENIHISLLNICKTCHWGWGLSWAKTQWKVF